MAIHQLLVLTIVSKEILYHELDPIQGLYTYTYVYIYIYMCIYIYMKMMQDLTQSFIRAGLKELLLARCFIHPVSVTRFPCFRTQTLESLSRYLWNKWVPAQPRPWRESCDGESCDGDLIHNFTPLARYVLKRNQ